MAGVRETTIELPLRGMSCAACAARIEQGLATLPGVKSAAVSFAAERATVTFDTAALDAGRREVDVLGVVFIVEPWRQQANHMHLREAAVARQLAHLLALAHVVGQLRCELTDDVTHPVRLLLAADVARDPA